MSLVKIILVIIFLRLVWTTPDIIIKELTLKMNIKTHIYFGFTKDAFKGLNFSDNTPKLLIYINTSEELKTTHDEPVLFIVQIVEDFNINQAALKVIKYFLTDRQFNEILLIDNGSQSVESYKKIFKAYWDEGFPHVLIYNLQKQLWSIKSYPFLEIEPTDLLSYIRNRKKHNLMGYPLRVLVTNDPPHCFVDERESPNSSNRYKGSIITIFKIFADQLNATFEAVPFPGLRRYNTAECLQMVKDNLTDACGSIFIRTYRYATSQPVRLNRVAIMAPFGSPIEKFYYFFRPFDLYVWIATGFVVVYISIMGSLLHRWHFKKWDVGQYLLLAIQTLLTRELKLPHCSSGSKLILLLLLFAIGFILSNLYVALLSMMLTTKLYQRPIENLADLKSANVNILLQAHNVRPNSFYGGSKELSERFLLVDESLHKERRDSLDPSYAYVDSEDRIDFYLYQQKFLRRRRMKKLSSPVGYTWAVQVIKQNWVLEQSYNDHIQRLFESGLQNKLVEDVHELGVRAGFLRFLPTQSQTIEPLRLEDIVMAAMVLGGGHALAGICFLGELLA
ncbi:glutamate receptor 3.3 [Drosophila ficusphila]|uniref:glutamate receptor 3.3 n=1 Tax=Drosophila ficusphila TaxID=30025 RepID=UPI0007E863F7|nr:glutamate receptor 3.3 [Drosophila ficusphila]